MACMIIIVGNGRHNNAKKLKEQKPSTEQQQVDSLSGCTSSLCCSAILGMVIMYLYC